MNIENNRKPEEKINLETGEIWAIFADRLFQYIRRRVASESEAEDILQNIFEKIHKNQSDKIINLDGWLYRIAHNAIIDHYRNSEHQLQKESINIEEVEHTLASPTYNIDSETGDNNKYSLKDVEIFKECVDPFLLKLKKGDKEILEQIQKGIPLTEVAKQMNISYSNVKSRAYRARNNLRKEFKKCCDYKFSHDGEIEIKKFKDPDICKCE